MYSSVKFFDPTVRVTLPLAGLDWIRLSELEALVAVVLLLLPPPHAAIATARAAASTSANAARTRRPLITPYPLSSIGRYDQRHPSRRSYAERAARCISMPFFMPLGVTSHCTPASTASMVPA